MRVSVPLLVLAFLVSGTASALVPTRRVLPASVPALMQDPIITLQICLDRHGYSCNTIDGQFGRKTQIAVQTYCAATGKPWQIGDEERARIVLFPHERSLFATLTVNAAHVAALVRIPQEPAAKARLAAMGYQTLEEMFAEYGHCSVTLLRKLNPTLPWPNPPVGAQVVIPQTSPFWDRPAPKRYPYGRADVLRVSLSRLEITAFNEQGLLIGLFPCSIAAEKNKLPPAGEIQVKTIADKPNYTYAEERVGANGRVGRYIYPPGPNNPVGTSWIGLTLPTYGIHGTPFPEQIGRAESHGCFRLANWNAEKLRSMCDVGTSVVIEQ